MEQQADTTRPLEEQPWDGVHLVKATWLEVNGAKAVTWASFDRKIAWLSKMLIEQISKATRTHLKELDAEDARLAERIAALEAEVKAMKADRPTLADSYKGTWQPSAFDQYQRGDACTFDGSIWIARTTTRAKPGSNDEWQLAVKKGRDAKETQ